MRAGRAYGGRHDDAANRICDDGKELYWLDSRGRDKAAVMAQDVASGATRVLAEDAEADCIDLLRELISLRPVAAYCAL